MYIYTEFSPMPEVSRTRKFELYSGRVNFLHPLELLGSKNNSKLRCFRPAVANRVCGGGFRSLKGQSTDGRWQAPDRVPFRKVLSSRKTYSIASNMLEFYITIAPAPSQTEKETVCTRLDTLSPLNR